MYKFFFIFIFLVFQCVKVDAVADAIPEPPSTQSLVTDIGQTGFLTASEIQQLEFKLRRFNDSTSNQVAVVIVSDLQGYEPSDFADRLAIKWKIGQKGLDNGILILIKPKTLDSKGEVQIRIGRGLEGIIPDLRAYDIIEHEMIPAFKQGNNFLGIQNATNVLMSLAMKEYSYKTYQKKYQKQPQKYGGLVVLVIFAVVFFLMRLNGRHYNTMGGGSSLPFWASLFFLSGMSGSRGSSGNWDDFSSGGGDFGGFGGGSFGGGGAGGSW